MLAGLSARRTIDHQSSALITTKKRRSDAVEQGYGYFRAAYESVRVTVRTVVVVRPAVRQEVALRRIRKVGDGDERAVVLVALRSAGLNCLAHAADSPLDGDAVDAGRSAPESDNDLQHP